jgi:cysteine desulfurase
MENSIYLDNNATTPCDPRVVEKMLPYFSEIYGNPANGYHFQGRNAAKAIDKARGQIAQLIGAQPYEIIFTGGATESNNLAIFGISRFSTNSFRNRLITSQIEHKAVLYPCKVLKEDNHDVVFISVSSAGEINLQELPDSINEKTLLVSIHLANNEIGTIQPIHEIVEYAHSVGAWVHTDAAQAIGKIPVHVDELGVDLLSMSAHKLYGPKGIGALYVRGGTKAIPLAPMFYGGGQEFGLRPGTSNVPSIVGFGEAAQLCAHNLDVENSRIQLLRDHFEESLLSRIPGLVINGKNSFRLPNTSSLTFPDVDADALLLNISDVMLGTGSACNSGALEPSHVLQAIGVSREAAQRTIRASFGRFNSEEQVQIAINSIVQSYFSVLHSNL